MERLFCIPHIKSEGITIFTPTYNRAYCLKGAYESLLRQTNDSFIWLIVDDGSTDGTKELVNTWIIENKIEIEYVYQENAGKMVAHNLAAKRCQTELFVCLDSDDQLTDTAVEEILQLWDQHHDDRKDLMGIIAPRTNIDKHGNITYVPQIPEGVTYTTGRGLYQHGYRGETAMIFRTAVLKKFPFPVQAGEKFISEVSAYDAMDEYYVMLAYHRPLMLCEYREDGYSKNLLKVNVANPKGVIYVNQQRQKRLNRFSPTLMREYVAYSYIANYSSRKIISNSYYPFFCFLLLPLGYWDMKKITKQLKYD